MDFSFLRDSGLLFEINRVVLHPYGYHLAECDDGLALETSTSEGGLAFSDKEMAEGRERLRKFFEEHGIIKKIGERVKMLGTVVQGGNGGARRDQKHDPGGRRRG